MARISDSPHWRIKKPVTKKELRAEVERLIAENKKLDHWLSEDAANSSSFLSAYRAAQFERKHVASIYLNSLIFQLLVAETRPPRNAELCFHLFLPPDIADSIVGDLDERFAKLVKRLGPTRAAWWYRKQVFTSMWPLAKTAIRRAGSSSVLGVVRFVLRVF